MINTKKPGRLDLVSALFMIGSGVVMIVQWIRNGKKDT